MSLKVQDRVAMVHFVGQFRFEDQNGNSLLPKSKKATGILAYCLYQPDGRIARETLVNLFWPDRQREQGLASLRQALHEVKLSLGEYSETLLEIGREHILTYLNNVESDLDATDDEIVMAGPDNLFFGLDFVSTAFDDWLREERRRVFLRLQSDAEKQLSQSEEFSDDALAAALRILAIEPENETAARAAMSCYAFRGENSKAASVYRALQAASRELGFSVSAKTDEIFDKLRDTKDNGRSHAKPAEVIRSGLPSLAVFPIDTSTLQGPVAEFARQINIELPARVSEVRELRALSNAPTGGDSTLSDGAHNPSIRSQADYSVSGSVFLDDNKLLGVFQNSRIRNGEILRTTRTQGTLESLRESALEAVEDIVISALPAIERAECIDLLSGDPEHWSAYQCYLKAKELIVASTDTNYMEIAEPYLERAIELDPSYTPPYAYLIGSYNSGRKITSPGLSRKDGSSRALALSRQFLVNDAQNPNAHLSMAWCLLRLKKFDDAEACLNEAIRYRLYDPNRINAMGTAFVWLGDTEKGLYFYDLAKRRMFHNLDFLSTDYGEAYYFRKDYEKAFSYLDVGELRNPVRTHILRCATLAQLGRLVEARVDAQRAIGVFRDRWKGNESFSVEKATKWYLAGLPLRRAEDMENLVHGLAKGGFMF